MQSMRPLILLFALASTCLCIFNRPPRSRDYDGPYNLDHMISYPGEVHLKNVRQLTFGGQNAEGYFSFDNKKMTFQATYPGSTNCDQIYQLDLMQDPQSQVAKRMSTGLGVTTCSFFLGDNEHFIYATTIAQMNITAQSPTDTFDTCVPKTCSNVKNITDPELRKICLTDYTWDIFPEMDIYKADKYGNIVSRLTSTPGYDAEGVVSPDGKYIAFTSLRSGDLELWIMDADGSNPRQVTNTLGYDGGSFFSPDGTKLVFRASRPNTTEEIDEYKKLLGYGLVAPTKMELFVINVDGTDMRQVTALGNSNWAPYYLNDGKRIIFSSDWNLTEASGAFDLWLINDDGTGLERVTWDEKEFDAFPMMSYDGKHLIWGSSRNADTEEDLNLFIAEWSDSTSSIPLLGPLVLFSLFLLIR